MGIVKGWGIYEKGKYKAMFSKEYDIWNQMIQRCYSDKIKVKRPTYIGCSVTPTWQKFQDFMLWAEVQIGFGLPSFQLDKDLLVKGNKRYCEEICVFIPVEINSFLSLSNSQRGSHPVGVCFHKRIGKFQAQITRGNGRESLGYFDSAEAAFEAYKVAKEAYAKELAAKWQSQIDPRAYEALMNYVVEITD